jgi:S1-C subfamily serine protease
MAKSINVFLAALVVSGFLAPAVGQAADEQMPRALYARTVRSAAWISTSKSWGSGSLVDRKRKLVVTNYHLVKKDDTVDVVFPAYDDGELVTERDYYIKKLQALAYRGKVIRREPGRDLAVIQLQKLPDGVPALKLATNGPRVGDRLYRLGTAAADGPAWKAIPGKVREISLSHIRLSGTDQVVKARMIFTDCGGRYGDSGSPVVNAKGELVGVHFSGSGSTSNAIDLKEIKRTLEEAKGSAEAVVTAKDMPGALYARTVRSAAWLIIGGKNVGSAFLVDGEQKLLLATYHAVRKSETVDVVFPAYSKGGLVTERAYYHKHWRALAYRGKVLRRDPRRDLALIRLKELPRTAVALKLADRGARAGDRLFRIGTPAAKGPAWKALPGKVTAARLWNVKLTGDDQTVKARLIETDCGGRYGDGGCPVVNAKGELVGVHFAGSRSTSSAIAIEEIKAVLEEDEYSDTTEETTSEGKKSFSRDD